MGSIIQELGTKALARLRIGIGPMPEEADPVEYVLAPFSDDERQRLTAPLERAAAALEMILEGDIDAAMNQYNAFRPPPAISPPPLKGMGEEEG